MWTKVFAFVVVNVGLALGAAHAQECLHGSNETAEQNARRREALAAARTINTIQANQPGAASHQYLRHGELSGSRYALSMRTAPPGAAISRLSLDPGTEILPNWELKLDVSPTGYWLMIRDKADPCGFAFISNQAGVIFSAEPIR